MSVLFLVSHLSCSSDILVANIRDRGIVGHGFRVSLSVPTVGVSGLLYVGSPKGRKSGELVSSVSMFIKISRVTRFGCG
jgi:hypothetical protein